AGASCRRPSISPIVSFLCGAAVASSLLSPERSAWIYGGGAPSRQQRGENCHRNESGCRARHRRHISWTDLEQHRGNQAARNHREREADDGGPDIATAAGRLTPSPVDRRGTPHRHARVESNSSSVGRRLRSARAQSPRRQACCERDVCLDCLTSEYLLESRQQASKSKDARPVKARTAHRSP